MSVRLRKVAKVCAFTVAGIVLVLAGALTLLVVDKPLVRKIAERYIARKAGVGLTIGKLDYGLSPLHVRALSLKISYATEIFTLDIAVDRVEALGDLKTLIDGGKPAFESVELDITELRLDQKEISPEPIDFDSLVRQTAGLLGYSKRVSARCARLVVFLPSQELRLEDVALAVSKRDPSGRFGVSLACEDFAGAADQGRLAASGSFRADGTLILGRELGFDLNLAVAGPRLVAAGKSAAVENVSAEVVGDWQPKSGRTAFSKLALVIPGLAKLSGSFVADPHPATADPEPKGSPENRPRAADGRPDSRFLAAEGRVDITSLESLVSLLEPFLPSSLHGVRIRGGARLGGKFTLPAGGKLKSAQISASIETDRVGFELDTPGLPLRGEIAGALSAEGVLAEPHCVGELRLSLEPISGAGASVGETAARFRLEGTKDRAEASVSAGRLRDVSISIPGQKSLRLAEIDFDGTVTANLGDRPAGRTVIETRLPGLAPIRISGELGLRPFNLARVEVESRGQPAPAIRSLLSPFLPARLAPWAMDGRVDVGIKLDGPFSEGRPLAFSGEIALSRGKFNDPEFTVAGDGLQCIVRAQGTYARAVRNLALTGTLDIAHGESLWKRFYVSWDKFPLGAEIAGRYDGAAGSLDDLTVKVSVPNLGEARASGRLQTAAPASFDIRTSVQVELEPALALLSGGSSPQPGPRLKGRAAGEIGVKKTGGGFALEGRVKLQDVSVDGSASGVSVHGLEADLPLNLGLPAAPAAGPETTPALEGTLRLGEVRTPAFAIKPPPLSLRCQRNALEIAPFSLEIFGSRVEIGETSLTVRLAPPGFEGKASLKLDDVDVSRLPFFKPGSSPPGKLRADFPAISLTPGAIRASGQAEAEVFGGRVVVTNLSVADPFAADREVACDLDLQDLDLKKITDLVPFGEVTGVIRGEVRDLVIAYGQPERFELSLESVKRRGVPQTFSLKAVNSLTVITTGQPATEGSGSFWLRFVRGFRYERIGISSALKNDNFTIDGTIRENGVEYLVKRPRLFGISVINRNPGKTIGFKDMMSRLQRVGQSSPPVINESIK